VSVAGIWSVHDVTPASFERVARVVRRLSDAHIHPLTILVIPSGRWTNAQIDTLRAWERDGHLLAAHGWSHRSRTPRTAYHRLHSYLFSRDVAEHLGSTRAECVEIISRGARWFADLGLAPPSMYVPPAWALGPISLDAFDETAYRWVETLTGIYSVRAKRFVRLPVVGFEADTATRAYALRALNLVNTRLAAITRRPLRIAIHPDDFDLRLADDLAARIVASHRVVHPRELESFA
jgi:predicted deacetylase